MDDLIYYYYRETKSHLSICVHTKTEKIWPITADKHVFNKIISSFLMLILKWAKQRKYKMKMKMFKLKF